MTTARLEFVGGTLVLTGIPLSRLSEWFPTLFWAPDHRLGAMRCDAL